MRILLVEDQLDLARHIDRALKRTDHEVSVAKDGPTAVDRALEMRFDLILLDVNLPGFDGFEVLKRLKEHSVHTRVLMLTARGEVHDRVNGLKAGADASSVLRQARKYRATASLRSGSEAIPIAKSMEKRISSWLMTSAKLRRA